MVEIVVEDQHVLVYNSNKYLIDSFDLSMIPQRFNSIEEIEEYIKEYSSDCITQHHLLIYNLGFVWNEFLKKYLR
jgi:hypothetical protein